MYSCGIPFVSPRLTQMETNSSLNLLSELSGKGLSLFILYRITLCPFPFLNGQKAPAPHGTPMVAPAAQTIPLSWHLPVQEVPVGIGFSMNRAEHQYLGVLGCSCRTEHPPGTARPFSDIHTHTEEEQFRPRDV